MGAEILFVGDVHLGRRPTRLPPDLEEYEISAAELSPAAAWRRVVRHAAETRVDAVVLAGDVVEADNARFEAFGQLHEGVGRLAERGVSVFAVAGNHDVDALPRLADTIDGFRLIGRGGRWESLPILRDGRPVARLLGWSFPERRWPSSPLGRGDLPPREDDDLPRLGVLHCDLGASAGPYAPVAREELERAAVDGWFLGHVHRPSALVGPVPIGYLGSLVGLDPGETGPHGPWRVRVAPGRPIEVTQLPLAPLRWETIELPVSDLPDAAGLDGAVHAAIEERHRSHRGEARAVGCRIVLTGSLREHRRLRGIVERGEPTALRVRLDDVLYFVESLRDDTRPSLDLEALAESSGPPALLASRLLALERRDESSRILIQRARRDLATVADDRTWSLLDAAELDEEGVRGLLLRAGLLALEALVGQAAGRAP